MGIFFIDLPFEKKRTDFEAKYIPLFTLVFRESKKAKKLLLVLETSAVMIFDNSFLSAYERVSRTPNDF